MRASRPVSYTHLLASIVLGAAVALIYMFRHTYSKNFVVTLALLPLIVQMVILSLIHI